DLYRPRRNQTPLSTCVRTPVVVRRLVTHDHRTRHDVARRGEHSVSRRVAGRRGGYRQRLDFRQSPSRVAVEAPPRAAVQVAHQTGGLRRTLEGLEGNARDTRGWSSRIDPSSIVAGSLPVASIRGIVKSRSIVASVPVRPMPTLPG